MHLFPWSPPWHKPDFLFLKTRDTDLWKRDEWETREVKFPGAADAQFAGSFFARSWAAGLLRGAALDIPELRALLPAGRRSTRTAAGPHWKLNVPSLSRGPPEDA